MSRPVTSKKCLANVTPELTLEWHPVKNGKLTPSDVSFGSHKKIWWRCNRGHEWAASVASRSTNLNGCPYCANKMVCVDNCLGTLHPELVSEWHLTKNNSLTPHDVVSGSGKYVWWICHKGHEWESRVVDRINGYGCPYCSNMKTCKDNCLATMSLEISQQWNPIKNGKLTPNDVTPGSNKNVWWICHQGHEWKSRVADRTRRGHNCPYCSGQKVCKDNCLATMTLTIP